MRSPSTLLLIICMSISNVLYAADIVETELESIDFSHLIHIRKVSDQIHTRSVYVTDDGSLYYKVWTPGYRRSSHFLDALESGFFEGLISLVSVIYDSDHCCRGYITKGGESILNETLPIKIDSRTIKNFFLKGNILVIAPIEEQSDQNYRDFYNLLLENTKKSCYAYIDLTPYNLIFIDGKYNLIDLESVEPFSCISRHFFLDICSPADYRAHIKTLCGRNFIDLPTPYFGNTYCSICMHMFDNAFYIEFLY